MTKTKSEYAKAKEQQKKANAKLRQEKEKLERRIGREFLQRFDDIESIDDFRVYIEKADCAYTKLMEIENQNITKMDEDIEPEIEENENENIENKDDLIFQNQGFQNNNYTQNAN